MLDTYAAKVKNNLKKAIGLLNRVDKMVDEKRYCVDVAQQMNAAIGVLRQTNNLILESHLLSCGGHKLSTKNKNERDAFVKELIQAFSVTSK